MHHTAVETRLVLPLLPTDGTSTARGPCYAFNNFFIRRIVEIVSITILIEFLKTIF